jgi:hypothetical protein
MNRITYTHSGWQVFCPIIFREADMAIDARWPWLRWLSDLAFEVEKLSIATISFFNPDWEPVFFYYGISELKRPITREYPDYA